MKGIILAAGMGTRLRPLTLQFPKSLLSIKGCTLFERNIKFFKDNGIDDITVVTGYMNHLFDDIVKKYDIKKVISNVYDKKNSSSSLNLVRDNLDDSIIINGDIYISENVFPYIKKGISQIISKEIVKGEEDGYLYDSNNRVVKVEKKSTTGYGDTGMVYLCGDLAHAVSRELPSALDHYFWEDIIYNLIDEYEIYLTKIPNIIYEIDSVEDILFYNLMDKEDILKLSNNDENAIRELNKIFSNI